MSEEAQCAARGKSGGAKLWCGGRTVWWRPWWYCASALCRALHSLAYLSLAEDVRAGVRGALVLSCPHGRTHTAMRRPQREERQESPAPCIHARPTLRPASAWSESGAKVPRRWQERRGREVWLARECYIPIICVLARRRPVRLGASCHSQFAVVVRHADSCTPGREIRTTLVSMTRVPHAKVTHPHYTIVHLIQVIPSAR